MMEYLELSVGESNPPSYVRRRSVDRLKGISAVIFDCDGVLIDVKDSYQKAVAATVVMVMRDLAGVSVDPGDTDEEVNFAFKATGSFNNDWDLTCVILMFALSRLPDARLEELKEASRESLAISDPYRRYEFIKGRMRREPTRIKGLRQRLLGYASRFDSTGLQSNSRALNDERLEGILKALSYPGAVGESIIPTLFEQIFSGSCLFGRNLGLEPFFETPCKGYIENESLIVKPRTFDELETLLGGAEFGVASGSLENTAKYVLGPLAGWFKPGAEVWMETVDIATADKCGKDLRKPNPYSLFKASMVFEPFKQILYVGDTYADLLMTKGANEEDPRYVFAGVYWNTSKREETKQQFFEGGADIVTPSVNELPELMEMIRS